MFPLCDFLIYCFVTAYTPGANNLLSMNYAIRFGFRRSLRFNFGILAGFTAVMTICTVCSAALFTFIPRIKPFLQVAGAAYMIYLACKIWRSSLGQDGESGGKSSFLSGMLLQFVNPKIYIYAITVMTLYVLPVYHSAEAMVAFTLILAVIGASASFVWALFGSAFCSFFRRHLKAVNTVMALLLLYCAVSLFL